MKGMLLSMIMLFGFLGCSSDNGYRYTKPINGKHHAIIMIKAIKSGGQCTAFVISDKLALTAAHCVMSRGILGFPLINKNGFKVYNSLGKDTKVTAVSMRKLMGSRMDYAVIKGDFSKFNKLPVMVRNMYQDKTDIVTHCGYATGTWPPICSKGRLVQKSNFQMETTGNLVPGMSGGPVINSNGVVIGINSAVRDDIALYCPTFGIIQTEK